MKSDLGVVGGGWYNYSAANEGTSSQYVPWCGGKVSRLERRLGLRVGERWRCDGDGRRDFTVVIGGRANGDIRKLGNFWVIVANLSRRPIRGGKGVAQRGSHGLGAVDNGEC